MGDPDVGLERLVREVAGGPVVGGVGDDASGGSIVRQSSGWPSRSYSQQRVWKRQPGGGLTGLGTSPLRMTRLRLRSATGSGTGTADSSARVYGWPGAAYSSSGGPISTILPRYMTATRSLMCLTTDRSWATNR